MKSVRTPKGPASRAEFRAAVKQLKKLFPSETREEIERVVWSLQMGNPQRRRRQLVAKAIEIFV